jgi:predicted DCC family thiol-disulfide oxidoreductase YuxK
VSVPTLLYDADCGFCRWCLAWVLRWDRGALIRPLPLQSPEASRLLADMPEHERMESWHLVDEHGGVSSAGDAFAPLLERLPRGRRPAALARALGPLLRPAYRLVAANRAPLGRLVPERSKRRAAALVQARQDLLRRSYSTVKNP